MGELEVENAYDPERHDQAYSRFDREAHLAEPGALLKGLSRMARSLRPCVAVDAGVLSNSGFTSFLNRYRQSFVALGRFRLVYVAAEHRQFRKAERAFDRFSERLTNAEALTPGSAMGEYFRLQPLYSKTGSTTN